MEALTGSRSKKELNSPKKHRQFGKRNICLGDDWQSAGPACERLLGLCNRLWCQCPVNTQTHALTNRCY